MLQEPCDKISECANPRQVASSLVKVVTYHCWFMTGLLPQEKLDAGYPQGMPRYTKTHIRDTFCICEAVNEVPYG
jgi:hypothetical protein